MFSAFGPLRSAVARSGHYAVCSLPVVIGSCAYCFQRLPRSMIARNLNTKVNGQYQMLR